MRSRIRGAAASFALAAVLALVATFTVPSSASAAPRSERFHASFENLVPASTRSATARVSVPQAAVVTGVTVEEDPAPGLTWDVTLCPSGGGECVPVRHGHTGARVAAGVHTLRIAVAATSDLQPGARSAIRGRIVLAADDAAGAGATTAPRPVGTTGGGALATTGASTLPLVLTALATTVVGLLLLLGARRQREDCRGAPHGPVPVVPSIEPGTRRAR
ncbi:hypothetical protein [Cellulomonas telluris]|uniref:hypothetical protein n=1 Tax=Cellulomonas telluris TaxID=2306636 RepID=UPI0010A7689C|nr:hypothetical protein [Cellulomonas telluris]